MALAPQAQLSVLLVNPGFSELTHLASHLADQGTLRRYVTTFRTTGEWQERISDRLPAAGRLLRRRRLPPGVPPEIVSIKGAAADITHALAIRMPPWSGPLARPLAEFALHHARFALGKGAAKLVQPGDVVIASYGCALEGFRVATDRSAVRVLNYPIAHHRYSRRLLEEEARRQPEFASSLQDHKLPFGWEERLDLECGLADRILVGSTFVKNTLNVPGPSR